MAVFRSKYRELSFYVDGVKHSFSCGSFATEDVELIAVLAKLSDVEMDEEKMEETKATEEVEPDKPRPTRRTSTKASAK